MPKYSLEHFCIQLNFMILYFLEFENNICHNESAATQFLAQMSDGFGMDDFLSSISKPFECHGTSNSQ